MRGRKFSFPITIRIFYSGFTNLKRRRRSLGRTLKKEENLRRRISHTQEEDRRILTRHTVQAIATLYYTMYSTRVAWQKSLYKLRMQKKSSEKSERKRKTTENHSPTLRFISSVRVASAPSPIICYRSSEP